MDGPIPVTTGFSWTAAGAWGTFLALLGIIARQVNPWRKMSIGAEEKMRSEMSERIKGLEDQIAHERAMREQDKAISDAEIRYLRHKLNNADHLIGMMFAMFKTNPDNLVNIVKEMQEIREDQRKRESAEFSAINSAKVTAANARDSVDRALMGVKDD